MVTQVIEFVAPSSQTLTSSLFAEGDDTVIDSASATEATNRKGIYSSSYTDIPAGTYRIIAFSGATPIAIWLVDILLVNGTYQAYELTKSGYTLDSSYDTILDDIQEWVRKNAVILHGESTNCGTDTETYTIGTLGITATITVDENGNRSSIIWS